MIFPLGLPSFSMSDMYADDTLKITASATEHKNEKPSAIKI